MDQDIARMSSDYEQKHLDKILANLDRLQIAKAKSIIAKDQPLINRLGVRINEVKKEYDFFKKGYGL